MDEVVVQQLGDAVLLVPRESLWNVFTTFADNDVVSVSVAIQFRKNYQKKFRKN